LYMVRPMWDEIVAQPCAYLDRVTLIVLPTSEEVSSIRADVAGAINATANEVHTTISERAVEAFAAFVGSYVARRLSGRL